MADHLDLNDVNVIQTILTEIEKSEEREKKTDAFDAWQIYSGNQRTYVEAELKRTRPKSWRTYTVSNISIAKMVTDKLSRSYMKQPKRDIEKGLKNERLEEIYEEGNAKIQLPFADKIFNLHKGMLFWVNWRDQEEKYQFMALQGHEYTVIRNKDTGELDAVILNYGNLDITANAQTGDGVDDLIAESQADSSAQSKVYAMWSRDNFVVIKVENITIKTASGEEIKKSITYIDIPDNPLNINFIGIIPFVYVTKEPVIDNPTKNPLAMQSVTYNALNSEGLTAANIQGTGQMVISYPEKYEAKFKNLTTGLTTAIKLPQSNNPDDRATTVQYISPSPDLTGQRDYYTTYLKQILAEHGITSSQGIDGSAESFSSGLERMIANADVQSSIEQNQDLYVDMEKRMFEIITAWELFIGKNTYGPDDGIDIVFPKPKLMVSDDEILNKIDKMLRLGVIEEWEKFIIIDPNLSEEDAREKLAIIDAAKAEKIKKMIPMFESQDDDNQDDEDNQQDDDNGSGESQ